MRRGRHVNVRATNVGHDRLRGIHRMMVVLVMSGSLRVVIVFFFLTTIIIIIILHGEGVLERFRWPWWWCFTILMILILIAIAIMILGGIWMRWIDRDRRKDHGIDIDTLIFH